MKKLIKNGLIILTGGLLGFFIPYDWYQWYENHQGIMLKWLCIISVVLIISAGIWNKYKYGKWLQCNLNTPEDENEGLEDNEINF